MLKTSSNDGNDLRDCEDHEDAAKTLVSYLHSMDVPVPKDGTEAPL